MRRWSWHLNEQVQQKHKPTQEELERDPSMHKTDTLDCLTCVIGEIHPVADVDDVIMLPGDSVVIRGTTHAWSNRGQVPCLLVDRMVDAIPQN
jgi:hypothetical protein